MIGNISMISILISTILPIIVPVILFVYFYKKYRISIKAVIVGGMFFIIFVMIIERTLHNYILFTNITTMIWMENPLIYALYGGLAAGIFEESARYISFKWILKNNRKWEDGVAYGIGHGGIEAILIGAISNLQLYIFARYINMGIFEEKLGEAAPLLEGIKDTLLTLPAYHFLMSGFERLFALCLQILLSILVLYSVKVKKVKFFLLAILLHMLFDIPAALFQKGVISNVIIIESILGLIAIIAFVFIIRSKARFKKEI